MTRKYILLSLSLISLLPAHKAYALDDFKSWVRDFKSDAQEYGVSKNLLEKGFQGVEPIERIIELDRKQPEGTITFEQYKQRVITKGRIRQGRMLYQKHKELLDEVSSRYGVPPQYIVALWGIETSYGHNTGGFGVIPALATLAYDGRRSQFFRSELLNAFKILDQGHIDLENMKGSWAGAMGQNQFMPSSFFSFAVDGNNDGKRDIWTSLPDVFSSTANYLHKSGWDEDKRWGREVKLPNKSLQKFTGLNKSYPLEVWSARDLRQPNGQPIPVVRGMKASLIQPDGAGGASYLVYDNYRVIMKWNRSTYFATSVGLLADAIVHQ